jgi:inner membrane protein
MDNVTHAIAGLLVADATALALTPRGTEPDARLRSRLRWASAIANNLPDLDGLYTHITPGRVGYLVHHRGHTHTLGVGMLLGLLSFFLLRALFRTPTNTRERPALLALSLAGPWIHLGMDFSNNYGVHPFWPLHGGWFYGDAVFIIEPLYFVIAVPALVLASRSRTLQLLLGSVVLIGVALAWVTRFAGVGVATFLTLAAVGCAWLTYRLAPRQRTPFAIGGALAVTLLFFALSQVARASVKQAMLRQRPGDPVTIADMSLAPAPSNPFCWSAMVVGTRRDRYELFVATVSVAPSLISVSTCELEPTGRTLTLGVASLESTAGVRWDAEWSAPLAELRELSRLSCDVRAYLKWARLPFWLRKPGDALMLGDLRYDRDPGLDFSETPASVEPKACPPWVPDWVPPRSDLLGDERR